MLAAFFSGAVPFADFGNDGRLREVVLLGPFVDRGEPLLVFVFLVGLCLEIALALPLSDFSALPLVCLGFFLDVGRLEGVAGLLFRPPALRVCTARFAALPRLPRELVS